MTKILSISGVLLVILGLSSMVFKPESKPVVELKWYSWEEAVAANEKEPKKIFVDVYTDWCGWCKRMDKTTFNDPAVSLFLADHFYAVKLDAEQKENIVHNGQTMKWVKAGRRGVHELAYALLDGKMSYPTTVFLNEKLERITISPGYKGAKDFMNELTYVKEEHYANGISFDTYLQKQISN